MANNNMMWVQQEPRGPSQLIEVPVQAAQNGSSRVNFPDLPLLRSTQGETIILKAMRLIIPNVLANAVIIGFPTSPLTEIVKATLVLYCEGWEKAQYIPLFVLNDMIDAVSGAPFRYNPTRFSNWAKVDWSKTYIQFSNGQVIAGAPYCFLFDLEYIKLNASNQEISGPS